MKFSQYRLRVIRKAAVLVAMAPLFQQIGWCSTGLNRTVANTLNGAPATYSQVLQGVALYPAQLLIQLIFGNGVPIVDDTIPGV
jgi:hypothetical protein